MLAFSVSVNFMESLSLGSASSGATPFLVFRYRLVWPQKAFGLVLACNAISRSKFLFAFRSRFLTLARARVYCCLVVPISFCFLALIHNLCVLLLSSTCRFLYMLVKEAVTCCLDKLCFIAILTVIRRPWWPIYMFVVKIPHNTNWLYFFIDMYFNRRFKLALFAQEYSVAVGLL